MRNFTIEEMRKLQPLEGQLSNAARFGFKRGTTHNDDEMVADILAAAGKALPRNWSCGSCAYAIWKEAGKNYFKTLEDLGGSIPEEEPSEVSEGLTEEQWNKMNPLQKYWYKKKNGQQFKNQE